MSHCKMNYFLEFYKLKQNKNKINECIYFNTILMDEFKCNLLRSLCDYEIMELTEFPDTRDNLFQTKVLAFILWCRYLK